MRTRTTILAAGLAAALAGASPAIADVAIHVDKSAQRMSVVRDGEPLYDWPVSTGVGGYQTPAGDYKPFRMEAEHFSKEFDDAPMPHSMFFTKQGHAIHGSNAVRSLGRVASHGCVRLSPANAATLFALVKSEGMARTRIVIDGVEPPAAREAPVARRKAPRPRFDPYVDDEDSYAYGYGRAPRRDYRDDGYAASYGYGYGYGVPAYRQRNPYGEYGPY